MTLGGTCCMCEQVSGWTADWINKTETKPPNSKSHWPTLVLQGITLIKGKSSENKMRSILQSERAFSFRCWEWTRGTNSVSAGSTTADHVAPLFKTSQRLPILHRIKSKVLAKAATSPCFLSSPSCCSPATLSSSETLAWPGCRSLNHPSWLPLEDLPNVAPAAWNP